MPTIAPSSIQVFQAIGRHRGHLGTGRARMRPQRLGVARTVSDGCRVWDLPEGRLTWAPWKLRPSKHQSGEHRWAASAPLAVLPCPGAAGGIVCVSVAGSTAGSRHRRMSSRSRTPRGRLQGEEATAPQSGGARCCSPQSPRPDLLVLSKLRPVQMAPRAGSVPS